GTGGLLEELACGKRLRSIGHDQRQRGTIALLRDHVARPQNKGGWGRLWCDERLNARLRSGFFTHDTFLRRRVGDAGRRHYTGFFRAGEQSPVYSSRSSDRLGKPSKIGTRRFR